MVCFISRRLWEVQASTGIGSGGEARSGFGYEKIEIVLSEPLGKTIGGGVDQAHEMRRMKRSREIWKTQHVDEDEFTPRVSALTWTAGFCTRSLVFTDQVRAVRIKSILLLLDDLNSVSGH